MAFQNNISKYTKGVTMPGGYVHFLPQTLRKIDRYWDGKFEKGGRDEMGNYKFFYQTSKPLCEDAAKNIDITTSMIRILPWGSGMEAEFSLWVYQRELREWLDENGTDALIDDLGDHLPKYGHVVVKKHAGGLSEVHLQNIRTDPAAPWLARSSFVYEALRLMRWEIEEHGDWNEKEISRLFRASRSMDFDVYECYDLKRDHYEKSYWAWVKKPNVASGGSNAAIEAHINQAMNIQLPPVELSKEDIDIEEFPYRELKWENIPGRWLGQGVMEYLFDNQLHDNETANLRMQALYLKALQFAVTSDLNLGGNVLRDMLNGQIIKTQGKFEWVGANNTDLAAYGTEEMSWGQNATKKMFSYDAMNIPARINKLILQRLLAQQQNYYKKKRQKLGMFIKDLLMDDVMPDFEKESSKKHSYLFSGSYDEMDQFVKFRTAAIINEAAKKHIKKTGFAPDDNEKQKEVMRVERELHSIKTHEMAIPRGFFGNLQKKIQMTITGENIDLQAETQWLTQVMQLAASNPAVLQNDPARTLIFKILEIAGISPGDLNMLSDSIKNNAPQPAQAPGQPQGQPQQQLPRGAPIAKLPTPGAGVGAAGGARTML